MRLASVTKVSNRSMSRVTPQLIVLLCLYTILQISNGIHLQAQPVDQNPNAYNKNLYLRELTGIQTRFNTDLQQIKTKFTNMNMFLTKTNASSSTQIIKLQETLAEERDALYNIQKYLSLPFALKSCECINFTDAQKKQLQKQITEVSTSIETLSRKINYDDKGNPYNNPSCPLGNCPLVIEIKRQIAQLQAYAKIMNDTVTSDCCKKINYIFRDNLVDSNLWVYAKLTEKQYRDKLIAKQKIGNMSQCPQALPFANQLLNQCFICPSNTPIFNLETRTCQQTCQSQKYILNLTTHNCDYNRACKYGQFFSNKTLKCEMDLGTSSRCPPDRPVWNPETLSCGKCPQLHPFYDINVVSCRSCTQNQIWDGFTMACYNKATYVPVSCPPGFTYNITKRQCEQPPKDNTQPGNTPVAPGSQPIGSGTSALCPPEAPYWNQKEFMCSICPEDNPLYNQLTKQCGQCPPNTAWNSASKSCIVNSHNCKFNQFWNTNTNKCQQIKPCNADETYNKQTGKCEGPSQVGKVGLCPPETPFWNEKTLFCQRCSPTTPLWNPSSKACSACPASTVYDPVSNQCNSNVPCPSGSFYDGTTKKCEPIKCPPNTPVFNAQKKGCEACPQEYVYNFSTNICQLANTKFISSVCPKDTPYWNSLKLGCQACANGQKENPTTKKCEAIVVNTNLAGAGVVKHYSKI